MAMNLEYSSAMNLNIYFFRPFIDLNKESCSRSSKLNSMNFFSAGPTKLMRSPPKCKLPKLSSSTLMVTIMRPTIILSYTWMHIWLSASSCDTHANCGSDTDRSLSVARAAGSHHIVAGNTNSWRERKSAFVTRCFVPCLGTGAWRRRGNMN